MQILHLSLPPQKKIWPPQRLHPKMLRPPSTHLGKDTICRHQGKTSDKSPAHYNSNTSNNAKHTYFPQNRALQQNVINRISSPVESLQSTGCKYYNFVLPASYHWCSHSGPHMISHIPYKIELIFYTTFEEDKTLNTSPWSL